MSPFKLLRTHLQNVVSEAYDSKREHALTIWSTYSGQCIKEEGNSITDAYLEYTHHWHFVSFIAVKVEYSFVP